MDLATVEWKTEYDVTSSLADMGHDLRVLGVKDDLGVIRQAVDEFKPHIAFNLMEAFHEVGGFDMNVVSYLELLRLPYTGCNPRGMVLSRDKARSPSGTSKAVSSTSASSATSVSRCFRFGRCSSARCQMACTVSQPTG